MVMSGCRLDLSGVPDDEADLMIAIELTCRVYEISPDDSAFSPLEDFAYANKPGTVESAPFGNR